MRSRALAMVGGACKEAKLSDGRIFRQVPSSANQQVISVDVAAIKKNQKPEVVLHAYDVIEVPALLALVEKRNIIQASR